jgi:hypothetical protein
MTKTPYYISRCEGRIKLTWQEEGTPCPRRDSCLHHKLYRDDLLAGTRDRGDIPHCIEEQAYLPLDAFEPKEDKAA